MNAEDVGGPKASKMLWGGRFSSSPAEEMLRLTSSISIDIRLLAQDLAVTRAHARTLVRAGLLDEDVLEELDATASKILEDVEAGRSTPSPDVEDVHSFVEEELTRRLGPTGARIHAGRSRNDLVATDLRLWCKDASGRLEDETLDLVREIADVAEAHVDTVMPGFTHLQRAQPVSLGFHLCAHAFALLRDVARFQAAGHAADVSALGAGALAGTTLPLDPTVAQRELGFTELFDNAMDAVSDRDFVLDLAYACAVLGVHLSRFAEEVVLWTSAEFSFARLEDAWSTGSSMMPQKRNPDLAELLRGRSAGGIGDLTALLSLMKGLPLAYDRDLQEDKETLFRTVDRGLAGARSARRLVAALEFDPETLRAAAGAAGTYATDLAETLVSKGVPFREAHEAAGQVIARLEGSQMSLMSVPDGFLAAIHPLLEDDDRNLADPVLGMRRRTTLGGPAPNQVAEQIRRLRASAG